MSAYQRGTVVLASIAMMMSTVYMQRPVLIKNINVTEFDDININNQSYFAVDLAAITQSLNFNPPAANDDYTFNFQGKFNQDFGKTGLFVNIRDNFKEGVDDNTVYSSYFFSGKDSFKANDTLTQSITWWIPDSIPQSEYTIDVKLKDWFNQTRELAFM